MKKIISGIVTASVVLGGLGTQSAYAASSLQDSIEKYGYTPKHKISVSVKAVNDNKVHLKMDGEDVYDNFGDIVTPILKNGRVLVPFRPVSEYMDASVKYDAKAKKVTITRKDKTVEITNGAKVGFVNGTKKTLDEPVQIINGSTYIPLRFVSESLGAKVSWTAKTKTANISVYEFEDDKFYYTNAKGELGAPIKEWQADLRFEQGLQEGREIIYLFNIKDLTDNTSRLYLTRLGKNVIDGKTYNTSYSLEAEYNTANTEQFTGDYYVLADTNTSTGEGAYYAQEGKKEFNNMQDVLNLSTYELLQELGFIKSN